MLTVKLMASMDILSVTAYLTERGQKST